MTTVDTDRAERGRRAFAEVMTFPPPDDSSLPAPRLMRQVVVSSAAGTTERLDDALQALQSVLVLAVRNGTGVHPLLESVGPDLSGCLDKGGSADYEELSPQAQQAMFLMWTTLHGLTCLEVFNHMDWMPPEAREELLQAQIELCVRIIGV